MEHCEAQEEILREAFQGSIEYRAGRLYSRRGSGNIEGTDVAAPKIHRQSTIQVLSRGETREGARVKACLHAREHLPCRTRRAARGRRIRCKVRRVHPRAVRGL